jgi:hypothetical protein
MYQHAAQKYEVDHRNDPRLQRCVLRLLQVLLSGELRPLPASRISLMDD